MLAQFLSHFSYIQKDANFLQNPILDFSTESCAHLVLWRGDP